jgi:hypothetical protein
MVLLNLARDGAEKAWVYLRDRLAAGMPERDVARWIALVAAAAGKLQTSIDVIGRRGLVLDENSERFIALASLVHNADLPEKTLPPTIAARMRLPGGRSPDRDRELERWVSLDLASPQHRFLESLLRLLLLEDLPTFAPLREIDRARLLERFPSLGFLTRERAAELDLAGQPAQAAATLVREIDEDSGDVESLRLLALYAPELDTATLDRMVGFADAGRLDPAHKALLAARAAFNHSSVEQGMSLLRAAAEDPGARAAALLAIARTEQTRLAPDVDLGRAPWCEAVAAARMTDAERRAETTVLQAAQATGTDPIVLRSIARRLRDEGASMRPAARQLLVAALVAQPGPWFEAHAIAIDEAANAGADAAALEQLGKGLEAALQSSPEGAAPLEAIDALTKLAAAGRRAGANESARRWLDLAARRCPYHPDVLALLGHFALEQDDLGGALRAFQRAAAFGCQDPEVHLWLGEHALVARGAPAEAKARCEKTLALAKASTDSDLRARAEETLAKAGFLLGQGEVSRLAWNAAAKERGEDPKLSLPAALESFARIGPEAARNRMLPLTKADGPAQKLLERLCSICEEQIAAQKAAPAPVPVGAAGGAQDTPAK